VTQSRASFQVAILFPAESAADFRDTRSDDLRDRPEAVHELLGVDFHLLQHRQHHVAQARFVVLRFAAERAPFVVSQRVVGVDVRPVVIDVLTVLEAERAAAGEEDRQVARRRPAPRAARRGNARTAP